MKKMDIYPPLQAIKDITQSIPSIWEDIAQAAGNQRKESLWRSDIYITSGCLKKEVLDRCYRGPEGTDSMTAAALSTPASWRCCKEVYRFAPEMEQMLYQQASGTLPINVLLHLPYSSFYIETPQLSSDGYHGFFVSLDQAIDGRTGGRIRLLRCFACASAGSTGVGLIELPLEEGKTLIDEIIPAAKRAASLVPISSKEAEPFLQLYILKTLMVITRLCQLILYIAA